jgi:hypothetical protein
MALIGCLVVAACFGGDRDAEITATSEATDVVVFLRAALIDSQFFQMQSLGPADNRDQIEAAFDRLVESFAVSG